MASSRLPREVSKTMTTIRLATSVLFALCLVTRPLWAQEPAPADDEAQPKELPRYEETVEVHGDLPSAPATALSATRVPVSLLETPASLSVVPRSLFESQQAVVMGDALRNASGVNVGTGFGTFDYFVIRGFDSLSTGLVLTDSVAEPESTFYPLYNVRQVEVLKGPGAFLYGSNPLSGAVQLVRKQPQARRFADLRLAYGSFASLEGAVDANAANDDGSLAFRVNGFYRDAEGYRDDKDSRLAAVNPSLTWRPDPATRVALNFEYASADFMPDSGLPLVDGAIPDVPRTRSYQTPFDTSEQDIYRVRVEFERQAGSRLTFRDRLYLTDLAWDSDGTLINGAGGPAPFTQAARSMTLLDDRQKLLGNQAEAMLQFATGSVRHELLAGFELSRMTDEFTLDIALMPNISVYQPVETAQAPVPIPMFRQQGDTRSFVFAPYLVDRLAIGPRVHVFAGARLDVLDYDDAVTATERNDTRCSPMAGITFSPRPDLSLYASAGTAFAPPSTLVVGPREPEQSAQIELGAKRSFGGGKAFASLAVYHLERDDIAIPDATGVARQNGDQRSRGLELELAGDVGSGLYVSAGYAFSDAELTRFSERVIVGFDPLPVFGTVDRSGNAPAFAPRHLANLWLMKRLPAGFGLAAGARYVGGQFIAEDNAFELDDYLLLDAALSYSRGAATVRVNFKNVSDRDYFTRGFGSASVIPGDPFAVYGSLELGFGGR
jgi:iron complex outermembrane receptor protein